MMGINKKRVGTKQKVLMLGLILLAALTIIGPTRIMVSLYYLKNGESIIINNHKIEFPFSHWAYFGESNITYVVAGKTIDTHHLSAEFFKNTKDIDISTGTANCDKVVEENYKSNSLTGTIYLCTRGDNETMYFQSKDKEIFIREDDFNSSNPKIVQEYSLLLDGIS